MAAVIQQQSDITTALNTLEATRSYNLELLTQLEELDDSFLLDHIEAGGNDEEEPPHIAEGGETPQMQGDGEEDCDEQPPCTCLLYTSPSPRDRG